MQLIHCMNIVLLENGLDLFLTTYRVMATGKREVLIFENVQQLLIATRE